VMLFLDFFVQQRKNNWTNVLGFDSLVFDRGYFGDVPDHPLGNFYPFDGGQSHLGMWVGPPRNSEDLQTKIYRRRVNWRREREYIRARNEGRN